MFFNLKTLLYILRDVILRDLKPENLLCTGPDNSIIKVTDFGLSRDFLSHQMASMVGTPDYVAPELLRKNSYDGSVDIWSIGVITFILLCGAPPFFGDSDAEMFKKILSCDWHFFSPEWDDISNDAKEFVSAILVPDPNDRPTASQCLQYGWIKQQKPNAAYTLHRRETLRQSMNEYTHNRRKNRR
eukprot:TRINITY_DN3082_c1_g1_i1.p1 TRINITY_DN3082_c1_g1~~TRINITY_DN3082_c1_g1_i1.p1  ORF type:complete len:186 (-),score=31.35 TRINITY_DN3082_c1_g1_i1:58-615(-)